MKIAFILDHSLMHYRVPFFRLLSEKYNHDIVVYHTGRQLTLDSSRVIQITVKRKNVLKVFDYRKGIDLSSFELVICMQNLRLLNLWKIAFTKKRSFRFIQWGIGLSSSKGLDKQSSMVRKLRNLVMHFADAVVFYSDLPLKYLNEANKTKSFVALNSVENQSSVDLSSFSKDAFIFIGSLNKRKGLRETIISFHQYLRNKPLNIKNLLIIGEGEEYDFLKSYIETNKLETNIFLLGRLDNPVDKLPYFRRSIASISLNQAGLSVLESFSFGVPFITKVNAISGGEHLNVKNFENGFLVLNENDFVQKLVWFDSNIDKANAMGKNAYDYYSSKANMNSMVDSFQNAIQYTQGEIER